MKIAFINGSPKINKGSSGALLEEVKSFIGDKAEIVESKVNVKSEYEKVLNDLSKAEVWVFALPLYIDGIPAHFLSFLAFLEEKCLKFNSVRVYGIVNCGFYEGIQNEHALKILQNWCKKVGHIWCGGIGIGWGRSLEMLPKFKVGHRPLVPIYNSLNLLADKVLKSETFDDKFVSVKFPRFIYKIGANITWRYIIKSNGGKIRDLGKRIV